MNELADIIITKLEVKQAQWDEEFIIARDIHARIYTRLLELSVYLPT